MSASGLCSVLGQSVCMGGREVMLLEPRGRMDMNLVLTGLSKIGHTRVAAYGQRRTSLGAMGGKSAKT